ncbi:hypothetical protein VTL71DRAFT_5964 [Oculimacula yallundae]|uniref:RRM domain-containing protein n=1 Tax=Oculimacula yallundae TaxID=86028 RepID=A0ABR4BZP8_9HELO
MDSPNPINKHPRDSPVAPESDSQRNVDDTTRWSSGQYSDVIELEQDFKTFNVSETSVTEPKGIELLVSGINDTATLQDTQLLFQDMTGVKVSKMLMELVTGRNEGYCFVECVTLDLANKVIQKYHQYLWLGRAINVEFADARDSTIERSTGRDEGMNGSIDETWKSAGHNESRDGSSDYTWKPEGLEVPDIAGRGVFVGQLPRFPNQAVTEGSIKDLFKDYNVKTVGPLISYRKPTPSLKGNWNSCIVRLESLDEEARAIEALNGAFRWNGQVTVRANQFDPGNPRQLFITGLPDSPMEHVFVGFARSLLAAFKISQVIPRKTRRPGTGQFTHQSCLVELSSEAEAIAAVWALDWATQWGCEIRVMPAEKPKY